MAIIMVKKNTRNSLLKKFSLIVVLLVGVITSIYFDLFNQYNIISATIDRLNGEIIYPQCEFEGKELQALNTISHEMGFSIVYTDCESFYTKGMSNYYDIMNKEISKINGDNWVNELYGKMKNNTSNKQ